MSSQGIIQKLTTDADHTLNEYDSTPPISRENFPKIAEKTIQNAINHGDGDRIRIEWLSDGAVRLHSTSYVGLISLPGGLTIEIVPKVEETHLLTLLQYSQGITADTISEETRLKAGNDFITAIAILYESELRSLIQRGLISEYRSRSDTEDHVRGRIMVQRQLQRHGPQPTVFECDYDALTQNTVLNQAILYSTHLLLQLIGDHHINRALQRHKQVLQRVINLRPVRPIELDDMNLSRLANHYEDIFRLTKMILRGIYAEELRAGDRSSFSLLVDMNSIFESVVQRALIQTFKDTPIRIKTRGFNRKLLWNDDDSITVEPDVLALTNDRPVFVGDAKWKRDKDKNRQPTTSDLYQILGYQTIYNAPGILFYPSQKHRVQDQYESHLEHDVHLIEIPTKPTPGKRFSVTVQDSLERLLPIILTSKSDKPDLDGPK